LHKLVAHAPSSKNRDDAGNPKTIMVGGTERIRYPSASIARVVRECVREVLIDRENNHVYHTAQLPREVMSRLPLLPPEKISMILSVLLPMNDLVKEWWKNLAEMRCSSSHRYTDTEIFSTSDYINSRWDVILGSPEYAERTKWIDEQIEKEEQKKLSKAAAKEEKAKEKELLKKMSKEEKEKYLKEAKAKAKAKKDEDDGEDKKDKKKDKLAGNRFAKELQKILSELPVSLDLAIFGRFLADKNQLIETIISAVCTADAFSTSETRTQNDPWVSKDDLSDKFKTQGGTGMGTRYVSSQVMFYSGTINVEALMYNLAKQGIKGDLREAAVTAIMIFVEAWGMAKSRVGQTSSADFSPPAFFNISAYEDTEPTTFQAAFFKPIYYADEVFRKDPVLESIRQYKDGKGRYVEKWDLDKHTLFDKWLSIEDEKPSDSPTSGPSARISELLRDFRADIESKIGLIDMAKFLKK